MRYETIQIWIISLYKLFKLLFFICVSMNYGTLHKMNYEKLMNYGKLHKNKL